MEDRPPIDDRGHAVEVARIEAAYRARDAVDGASVYSFESPGYAFYMQTVEWSLLQALGRSLVALRGARVLEVGCGTGYFLHRLVEFGAGEATGVDLMPARIEAARERYPGLQFACANAAELPFGDAQFDVVTQFTCLSSVLDRSLRSAIATEMWRVLSPGGVVVSFDMRPPPWPVRAMRSLGAWRRGEDGSGEPATPTTGISRDELKRLFDRGSLDYSSVGLAFGLCSVADRSYLAARALATIPGLREHAIGVVRKPSAA
jgi:SAM-dependent methyltransferase